MTNMIFAPRNATVIEFAMNPHVDRCYGYMAVALGMEYWLVPQVSAFYHLNYTMDSSKAEAVVRLVQHVLKTLTPETHIESLPNIQTDRNMTTNIGEDWKSVEQNIPIFRNNYLTLRDVCH